MKFETKRRIIDWVHTKLVKLLKYDDTKIRGQLIHIEHRKLQIARSEHIFDDREFLIIQMDIAKHQVAMMMFEHIMRKTEAVEYTVEPNFNETGRATTKVTATMKFILP